MHETKPSIDKLFRIGWTSVRKPLRIICELLVNKVAQCKIRSHTSGLRNKATKVKNWLTRKVNRKIAKRKAKKLLALLVTPERGEDEPAASGLIRIVKQGRSRKHIVAQRFLKTASRRDNGTRALLKLSDDELDELGYKAIHPISEPTASMILLDVVLGNSNETLFFKRTISPALKDGREGTAAILYLGLTEMHGFFLNISERVIFDFCQRILHAEVILCPKWYCGVKLLCALFLNLHRSEWKYSRLLPPLLSEIFKGLIQQGRGEQILDASAETRPEKPSYDNPQLLSLIASCCEEITEVSDLAALPPSDTLGPFIELSIDIILPEVAGSRSLSTERGLAMWALIPLLKFPSVVGLIPANKLPGLGFFLLDMTLHPKAVKIQEVDNSVKLDKWAIVSLSRLPDPTFSNALSSALNEGTIQLDSPEVTPYKALGLVERLLWISNIRMIEKEQAHRVLVDGGACEFLARALQGDPTTQDRGLWRAKGLAMTCLGNIVEMMNEEQCREHVTKEMVESIVAIKEHGDVPLVQKGQAIFTLQRYTLVAERWAIQPYYHENPAGWIYSIG
ncbi:hypothetical protein FRC05_004879 [Tulasnella sp. 425]|nr:hypothetical protein FRC05_004879 [Tulasnella sp. 425]